MEYLFVQKDTTKLFKYLDEHTINDLIFYTNVKSKIRIGNEVLNHKMFDTIIYTINPEFIIFLQKDGIININDLKKYLSEKKILFNEVSFLNEYEEEFRNDATIKELNPIFNEEEFIGLIKQDENGIYYPKIKSNIELFYYADKNTIVPLHNFKFNGLITTRERIILFPRLINLDIPTICKNNNFRLAITYYDEPKTHMNNGYTKQLHL